MQLSDHEKAMLMELVKESNGLGWPVAVYPFKSNVNQMKLDPVDANLAIAGLQEKGLLRLEERAGIDRLENQPSLYPVYVLTTNGFTEALKIRNANA